MKKTPYTTFLDLIAPHYCYFCGKIGKLWCDDCQKHNNFSVNYIKNNKKPLDYEFYISQRDGILKTIVDVYKFNNIKQYADILGKILADSLGANKITTNKQDVIIVPIPTVRRHIRERGYDHIKLLSESFCYWSGLTYQMALSRLTTDRQRGASAKDRRLQAKKAFKVFTDIKPDIEYILLDDIKTTGSTLDEAAKVLRNNGATKVAAIYILKQE